MHAADGRFVVVDQAGDALGVFCFDRDFFLQFPPHAFAIYARDVASRGVQRGNMPTNADAGSLILDASTDPDRSAAAEYVRGSLFDATHHVFVGLVVLAVLMAGAILLMPRRSARLEFD